MSSLQSLTYLQILIHRLALMWIFFFRQGLNPIFKIFLYSLSLQEEKSPRLSLDSKLFMRQEKFFLAWENSKAAHLLETMYVDLINLLIPDWQK